MRRAYHYRHRLRRPLANLISSSLEVAYLAGAAHAAIAASGDGDPRPLGDTDEGQDDEMVFTGISLSCATEENCSCGHVSTVTGKALRLTPTSTPSCIAAWANFSKRPTTAAPPRVNARTNAHQQPSQLTRTAAEVQLQTT
jgi:hypothetical protein